MKQTILLLCCSLFFLRCTQNNEVANNRQFLIEQLKNTHNHQEWFVPLKNALHGITVEQSIWNDTSENHSIAALASHILYWNKRNLMAFKGEELHFFDNNNDSTFTIREPWDILIKELDSVQTEWKTITQTTSEAMLNDWKTEILNMTAHTAYHTGQIIYIRKHKGWWSQ